MRLTAILGVLACLCSALVTAASAGTAYQPTHVNLPSVLPDATQGKSYGEALAGFASGGTGPPYDWNAKGRLPAGLSLGATSGRLGGTPTKTGTFSFTVCATGHKRPVGGSAPGNTACGSTSLTVNKAGGGGGNGPPAPACTSFTLSANPPGVNVDIDGSRQTSVITVNWQAPSCGKSVTFSTVGSPPTGLSVSFGSAPAGTIGTTLSLAAAQDATAGTYNVTILGTSGSLTAQTVVTVTINAPNFAGTYSGTWSGTFVSSQPDMCAFNEGGSFSASVVESLPGDYTVTMTFTGRTESWTPMPCTITQTTNDQFTENGTYSSGSIHGTTFTITGNSISGKRTDVYPGGTETSSFMAQR